MESILVKNKIGEVTKIMVLQIDGKTFVRFYQSDICANNLKAINSYQLSNISPIMVVNEFKAWYLNHGFTLISPKISHPTPYYLQYWCNFNENLYKRLQIARFNLQNV